MEITCVVFDWSLHKMLTGDRLGQVKVWNYNVGHLIRELQVRITSPTVDSESLVLHQRRSAKFLQDPNSYEYLC